jgi:hypothetical protein
MKFLRMLSDVLRYPGNTAVARMAAGLYLKNQLTAKDEALKLQVRERWLAFPPEDRGYIKNSVRITSFASVSIYYLSLSFLADFFSVRNRIDATIGRRSSHRVHRCSGNPSWPMVGSDPHFDSKLQQPKQHRFSERGDFGNHRLYLSGNRK